jgi:hypothetical protein
MIGAAVAVAHGAVPADVLRMALAAPLRVDAVPLRAQHSTAQHSTA